MLSQRYLLYHIETIVRRTRDSRQMQFVPLPEGTDFLFSAQRLVFLDESGLKTDMIRHHVRALKEVDA